MSEIITKSGNSIIQQMVVADIQAIMQKYGIKSGLSVLVKDGQIMQFSIHNNDRVELIDVLAHATHETLKNLLGTRAQDLAI